MPDAHAALDPVEEVLLIAPGRPGQQPQPERKSAPPARTFRAGHSRSCRGRAKLPPANGRLADVMAGMCDP